MRVPASALVELLPNGPLAAPALCALADMSLKWHSSGSTLPLLPAPALLRLSIALQQPELTAAGDLFCDAM